MRSAKERFRARSRAIQRVNVGRRNNNDGMRATCMHVASGWWMGGGRGEEDQTPALLQRTRGGTTPDAEETSSLRRPVARTAARNIVSVGFRRIYSLGVRAAEELHLSAAWPPRLIMCEMKFLGSRSGVTIEEPASCRPAGRPAGRN